MLVFALEMVKTLKESLSANNKTLSAEDLTDVLKPEIAMFSDETVFPDFKSTSRTFKTPSSFSEDTAKVSISPLT